MSFFYARLFVTVVLMSVVYSTPQNSSCPDANLKPRKTLQLLRQNFMFVEKPSASLQSSLGIPRRVPRNVPVKIPGTTQCPWTWGYDDNPDRVPRFLTKAACPNCGQYCRKVLYYHRGLVQICDATTGEIVWEWIVVQLPVAYVFDP